MQAKPSSSILSFKVASNVFASISERDIHKGVIWDLFDTADMMKVSGEAEAT